MTITPEVEEAIAREVDATVKNLYHYCHDNFDQSITDSTNIKTIMALLKYNNVTITDLNN
jgi:predicted transport protein